MKKQKAKASNGLRSTWYAVAMCTLAAFVLCVVVLLPWMVNHMASGTVVLLPAPAEFEAISPLPSEKDAAEAMESVTRWSRAVQAAGLGSDPTRLQGLAERLAADVEVLAYRPADSNKLNVKVSLPYVDPRLAEDLVDAINQDFAQSHQERIELAVHQSIQHMDTQIEQAYQRRLAAQQAVESLLDSLKSSGPHSSAPLSAAQPNSTDGAANSQSGDETPEEDSVAWELAYPLRTLEPKEALALVRPVLGVPAGLSTNPEGTITLGQDEPARLLIVKATSAEHEVVQKVLAELDQPTVSSVQLAAHVEPVANPTMNQMPSARVRRLPPVQNEVAANAALSADHEALAIESLKAQLNQLSQQRDELLSRMLPIHPDVAAVERHIAQVKERLSQSEALLASKQAQQTPAETEPGMDEGTRQRLAEELERYQQIFAEATTEQADLTTRRDHLVQEFNRWRGQQFAVTEPATSISSLATNHRARHLSMSLLFAGALGAVVWVLMLYGESTFYSLMQAQRLLPIPVVGAVRSVAPQDSGRAMRRAARFTAQGSTISSEVVLGMLLVWMLVLAMCDSGFGGCVFSDPLLALSELGHRTMALFGKH